MTGPLRDLWHRPTAQPAASGRPACWRDREHDDGQCCALCYTPQMQQGLLRRSPGCAGCWAGINAAALYYAYREPRL